MPNEFYIFPRKAIDRWAAAAGVGAPTVYPALNGPIYGMVNRSITELMFTYFQSLDVGPDRRISLEAPPSEYQGIYNVICHIHSERNEPTLHEDWLEGPAPVLAPEVAAARPADLPARPADLPVIEQTAEQTEEVRAAIQRALELYQKAYQQIGEEHYRLHFPRDGNSGERMRPSRSRAAAAAREAIRDKQQRIRDIGRMVGERTRYPQYPDYRPHLAVIRDLLGEAPMVVPVAPAVAPAFDAPAFDAPAPVTPPAPPPEKVVFADLRGDITNRAGFREIATRILGPTFEKVIISCPHNHLVPAQTTDFHIHIWSSPTPGRIFWRTNANPDVTVYGRSGLCFDGSLFGEWLEGNPIHETGGREIAAFDEHNLFIYIDASHHGSTDESYVFEEILKQLVDIRTHGAPPRDDKTQYVRFCMNRANLARKMSAEEFNKLNEEIKVSQARLIGMIRDRDTAFRMMNGKDDDRPDLYAIEWDRLKEHKRIKNIAVRGEAITLSTDMVDIRDPRKGEVHEIGEFDITIYTTEGRVIFRNKTRLVDGYQRRMHHPHVMADGAPCFGNVGHAVHQYVAAHEYAALATVLIAYLEQADVEESAGSYLNKWPTKAEVAAHAADAAAVTSAAIAS